MTKARTLADNYAADISGITAGTGITGGGTSGTVTITNEMATTIDAKGDLVVGTGADTFGRLAVASTAGYLLTVDSAETTGLKWAAAPATTPTFVGVRVYDSGSQTISNATETDMTWNSETFDTDGFHSTSSNTERFTVPSGKAGYYLVQGVARWDTSNSNKRDIYLVKTSSSTDTQFAISGIPADADAGQLASGIVYLAVGDYVRMKVYQNAGSSVTINKGSTFSYFAMTFLGA